MRQEDYDIKIHWYTGKEPFDNFNNDRTRNNINNFNNDRNFNNFDNFIDDDSIANDSFTLALHDFNNRNRISPNPPRVPTVVPTKTADEIATESFSMLMQQMTQMDDSSKERIGILDKNIQEHTQTLVEQFGKKQEEMKTEIYKTIDEKVDKSHAVLLALGNDFNIF
jgi:hypothetical protein